MGLTLAVGLFFALFAAWAALPLLPALIELRRRTDVKPLRVVRASDVDIRHFAHRFRVWLDGALGEPIAACRAGGAVVEGTLADGTRYAVLPDGAPPPLVPDAAGPATCPGVLVGCGRLGLPAGALFPFEVYAANSVEVGERTICRAILADGDLQLGRGCWSLRWLHARVALLAREGCALHGRASANISMRLEEGCRFERLHAPTIVFGAPAPLATAPAARAPLVAGDVPRLIDDAAGRWLVRGDLTIPAGRIVTADLVATGNLRVGAGALVEGGLKCHGDLELEGGVEVNGSVVSARDLRVGRGCRIHGPVIAEREARIGSGTRLGTAERPTTLSVRQLEIEAGAVAHGTVWAHGGAVVLPRPAATEVH
ncbi:MAG: bactofilin family protein [Candidatus Krumholzibacteriia bacterium]